MSNQSRTASVRYGEGSIIQRGETSVQARWLDNGKHRAKTFRADTLDAAWDVAEDFLRKIARDRRDGRYVSPSSLTVRHIVEEYAERGASRWSTNTQATYGLIIRKQIIPFLGNGRIIDLTPRAVQLWVDRLGKEKLSASLIENAKIVLSGACREAVQMGIIATNPTQGVRLPSRIIKRMPTWTPTEVRTMLAACEDDLLMRTLYVLALTTGMRPGELRALKWKDVDFPHQRLHCERTFTRDAQFRAVLGTKTKSGRDRVIAMADETIDALTRWKAAQDQRRTFYGKAWANEDFVFDRGNGEFLHANTVEHKHVRLQEVAGVTKIRLHDLRHTAATLMIEADVHPKIVSDILGHSSIAITMDRYAHPGVDLQRKAVTALGGFVRNVLPTLPVGDADDEGSGDS